SGRIGALASRRNGQFILGAAQGGIWLYNPASGTWTPKTDQLASTAIGALAVAPKDDNVVYAGTGEGALSGDSYYGNGILKSTDGGNTWAHVSGDFFAGVSTARLAVDRRELRGRHDEVQPGPIAPGRTWGRSLHGIRLGGHRQPPPRRTPLQVH